MRYGTHNVHKRHVYGDRVPTFRNCIHVDGWTGKLCGEPTKDGRQRCTSSETRLQTSWRASRYAGAKSIRAEG